MKRTCGTCTLCCRLLPVKDLAKPANARCTHQTTAKGCGIYEHRPLSCRLWSCRWLTDETTGDLRRPDRAHYCIDIVPDFVTIQPHDDTPEFAVPVVQVWVDPAHPDAHRDPALRRWLAAQGEKGMAALIRTSSRHAFALFPPAITGGKWVEKHSDVDPVEHTPQQIAEAMHARR